MPERPDYYDRVIRMHLEHGDMPDDELTAVSCAAIAHLFFSLSALDAHIYIVHKNKPYDDAVLIDAVHESWREVIQTLKPSHANLFRIVESLERDIQSETTPPITQATFTSMRPFDVSIRRPFTCGTVVRDCTIRARTKREPKNAKNAQKSLSVKPVQSPAICQRKFHSVIALVRCRLSHDYSMYDRDDVAAFWDNLGEHDRMQILALAPTIYPDTTGSILSLDGHKLIDLLDRILEGTSMCGVPLARDALKLAVDNAGPVIDREVKALFAHSVSATLLVQYSQAKERALLGEIESERTVAAAKAEKRRKRRDMLRSKRLESVIFGGSGTYAIGTKGRWWEEEDFAMNDII